MTGVGSSKSLCHDVEISYSALTIFKGARQYSIDYTLHSRSGAPDACEVNGSMCIAGADTVWGSSAVQPVRELCGKRGIQTQTDVFQEHKIVFPDTRTS